MAAQPNTEGAVNIANEYISSIDNLSAEMHFLLGEIKRKDDQIAELELKAVRKSNELFGRSRGNGAMTPREQNSIDKVRDILERVVRLNEEKTSLALELRRIVSRSVGRLDHDLGRIRKALGTEDPLVASLVASGSGLGLIGSSGSYSDLGGLSLNGSVLGAHTSAQILPQLQAHQLQAAGSLVAPAQTATRPSTLSGVPPPPDNSLSQQQSQKRRKLNGTASVLAGVPAVTPAASLVSIGPVPTTPLANMTPARSRPQAIQHQPAQSPAPAPSARKRAGVAASSLISQSQSSQQAISAPPSLVHVDEYEMEEDEEEAVPDEEDNQPYCYCHQPSHGEMVACDGDNCPYEWVRHLLSKFHLACLGMKHAPKNSKWFCSECQPKQVEEGTPIPEKSRKGRR